MSEKMYPIPFKSLMNWVVTEYAMSGEIFGVHKAYKASGKSLPIFGERIETPFGPAAGPNSQLAQNIIAAYFAGARFFEVKTVQKMDGADPVSYTHLADRMPESQKYIYYAAGHAHRVALELLGRLHLVHPVSQGLLDKGQAFLVALALLRLGLVLQAQVCLLYTSPGEF